MKLGVLPLPEGVVEARPIRHRRGALPIPRLHSNPSASAKLFLSFGGRNVGFWGSWSNVTTPPCNLGESDITSIWKRVSYDYSQFNIDVTTEDPENEENRVVAVISIGGSWQDWYGNGAGGVAWVGGFYNLSSNVGFVFSDSLGNSTKYISDASTHEAGHLFGLSHQSQWENGVKIFEYRTDGAYMGVPYSHPNPFWTIGQTSWGGEQDDVALIRGPFNGFGLREVSRKFKCSIPTNQPNYAGELLLKLGTRESVIPIAKAQPELKGLAGYKGETAFVSFDYVDELGRRSGKPATASLVL
jgi:hypothetical protein